MIDSKLSRRDFGQAFSLVGLGALAAANTPANAAAPGIGPRIHRHIQTVPFPVNAYLVEGTDGLVVIDSTLTNSSSRELRAKIDAFGKPLKAILLTHPHPDHYAGLGNLAAGLDVPIISVAGVNDIVRRDDEIKNQVIGGLFKDEWPSNRVFPNHIVKDGDKLNLGPDLSFEVRDIGPAESLHDSLFILQGATASAFAGDIAYGLMHPFMADNVNPQWLSAIARLQSELPEDLVLHVGHGLPVTPGFMSWQKTYIQKFEEAIATADWKNRDAATTSVVTRMKTYLPSDDLLFLMQLSILPNAKRLGLIK